MRRLTVVQLLPALEAGGVERSTLEIADALVRAGHRAVVVSAGGRLLPQLQALGAEHIALAIGSKSPLSLRHLPALRRVFAGADIVHARSRLPAWLGWLVKHDAGDELVHDVARLHRAALDAVDLPPEASRVFVGQCVGLDCPGELWAHFPRATDERPAIRCTACGEAYDPDTWRRLGERVQARVTQQEAARRLAEAILGRRT